MFNYSLQVIGTEWMWIVFLVIFLLFGSKKLPELSRALGKAMGEIQRGREEIEREFRQATANPPSPPKNLKTYQRPSSRFAKAAENMGLESKGKSDEELRKDIINFLSDKDKKKEESKDKQKTNTTPKPQ